MTESSSSFQLRQPSPPLVGAYWLGGYCIGFAFHLSHRPSWFHRCMMRWALGWQWVDAE